MRYLRSKRPAQEKLIRAGQVDMVRACQQDILHKQLPTGIQLVGSQHQGLDLSAIVGTMKEV